MKIKVTILFLLFSVFGFSQDLESMKIEVQKLYDLTIEKKYDFIIESTYPKVFEIIPKEQFLKLIKDALKPEGMTISIEKVDPKFTFEDIIIIGESKYCIIEHNNKMLMKFDEELGDSKEMFLGLVKASMKNYNVTLDEKTEIITLDGKAKMIAISDKSTNGTWKYINYNGESPMMEKILSKEVLQKLGL